MGACSCTFFAVVNGNALFGDVHAIIRDVCSVAIHARAVNTFIDFRRVDSVERGAQRVLRANIARIFARVDEFTGKTIAGVASVA